jgi:pimeloyl-ACP methyl ester carboxylesterase
MPIVLISALCFLIGIGFFVSFVISIFIGPDFLRIPSYYPFKSEKMKESYYAYYDKRVEVWPVPSEARFIETSFGKTFVRVCGPDNAPPLVLLPSAFASSLIWIPNIPSLSRHFRIYALDNIYDVGRSINTRSIKNSDNLVHWLDELFTALELGDRINLMGLSFGGWLTSQYALRFPHRLHKIILAAPIATVLPIPGAWSWRGILGAFPNRFFMTHFLVNWMFQDLVQRKDDRSITLVRKMTDDAMMGMKCYKFRMPITPTVLTDSELQGLKIPVLFLVGEHEVVYPARDAIRRFHTLAPAVKTEIIPDASHDLTISQTRIVDDKVIAFLRE